MKPKVTSERPLHYTQSSGDLQAFSQSRSRSGGIVTGLLLLAFVGMFVQNAVVNPSRETITSAFGASFVTLLVFGIIPVVMLRRQRITLNQSGLESRFFVFAFPVWRNFIPLDGIESLDSVWDGGSDEGACERLLIRKKAGESHWGIDAEDKEIEVLAKRLGHCLRQLRSHSVAPSISASTDADSFDA